MKFQWSKAGATLGDYKEFIRTWGEAVNSIGFTDKQVGMQLDTISRRIETLKTDMLSLSVSGGQAGITGALKDTIGVVDNFVAGLKEIPAWSIEAAGGLAIAAKAFVVLKNAILASNAASMASRATPLGLALTALATAAVFAMDAIGAHANAQREANRQASDAIAIAQQQQQQLDKQVEFADALMGAHQKLQAQVAGSTEGTEQYNKAIENQQETEKQLTKIFGEAAVERIKDANWSIDAYNQEKQAFEDGVSAKKKALQQMVDARILELETERDVIATSIENYWKDADNFKNSIELKAKYLGWWKALQMEYSEWKIGNAESGVNSLQKQLDEIDQQMSEGGNTEILSRRKEILQGQLEQEQASLKEQQDAYQKTISGGTADLQAQKSELDQQIIGLKQQSLNLAQVPSGLKIATEPKDKTKGPKNAPVDTSEQIQKKLDNYNVKSIEDQAAIAQDRYKSRLDAITDATNRYGKSYAFLDSTTATMNQHVSELQATTAALSEQLTSDLQKANEFASATGATISTQGTNDGSAEGTAWNFFKSKGYSSELTAGIIGNLMTESGMQTGVWADDKSGSYGIGQWKDGRLEGLKDFASSLGASIDDLNTQLAYVDYELKNNESQAFQQISNADLSQPESSAYAVSRYYERPAYAGNPERQQNARDVYDKYMYSQGGQVNVSIPQEVLMSSGMSQESFNKMSVDSKKEFITANKEQIKDANLLIGYLTQVADIQKKVAEYEKKISDERKKQYEALIKGIQEIESFQVKRAELSNRTSLASLGYYATDSDKAVAAQQLTQQKLAASNAALAYAKSKGVDIFTDPIMSEERVKNLELQQQMQQQNTFATPEAKYKQRMAEVEYQQKLSQYGIQGNATSPYNAQVKYFSNLEAAEEKVKSLKTLLKEMQASDPFASQTEEFKKYNLELLEATKNAKELADTYSTKMKQGVYDVTNELLLQGKSIQDIWKNLWKQLAEDALKNLMRIKNDSPGLLSQALGIYGGASKSSTSATNVESGLNLLATAATKLGSIGSSAKSSGNYSFNWGGMSSLLDKGVSGAYSGASANNTTQQSSSSKSSGTAWGSILGSLVGLFHAKGGVVDSPAIAGEDGEEVIIPVEKNKGNSANLLSYAASKLGQKSSGVTADFSSKDIAKTAMNVSVNSATNMAKTNGILATQNQILTTMLNNMGQQQGVTNVIVAGGSGSPSMEDQASAYNTLVARRQIKT